MKRSKGNEAKRNAPAEQGGLTSSQRLGAAGSRAIEAHVHVRWLAERLGEELASVSPPHDPAPQDLDPEDPVVVAVEKATSTMKAVTASMAAVSSTTAPALASATKPGVAPGPDTLPALPAKTKLGVGTGTKRKKGTGEE